MKIKTLFFVLVTALTGVHAQTLEAALLPECQVLDTAYTLPTLYMEAAKLDLIASKWPNEWAANYYAAYAKARLSYAEPNPKKKDLILDQGDKYLEKVLTLKGDSSEKHVLAAMLANARLAVDGNNRWQKFGEIFEAHLNKAKALNENNPRIYHLKGTTVFYTPKMFGGGPKNAKEYFLKAKDLFDKESKATPLVPYWGASANAYLLSECDKD